MPAIQEKRAVQGINTDSHHAKMNRMEAPASAGFSGGIPAKIEEGVEPREISMKPAGFS